MWLFIPDTGLSISVPEAGCSENPCISPWTDTYEPWLTLSGKPVRRPLSWRGWKTRPWIRRLSGMMLTASQARSFSTMFKAYSLLRCAPVIPASLSATQGSGLASLILGIYGPRLIDSLARRNPNLCSLKTSQGILGLGLEQSAEISKAEVMLLRLDFSARRKSAQAMSGNGCSFWRSPEATEGAKGGPNARGSKGDPELCNQAVKWQTPAADSFRTRGGERKNEPGLTVQARLRPTPRASANENRTTRPAESHGNGHGRLLAGEASTWQTPRENEAQGSGYQRDRGRKGAERATLTGQARLWPTKSARDYKGANSPEHMDRPGKNHESQLPNFVFHCLPQGLATPGLGEKSSNGSRRLNPAFVELLMGWPVGWTRTDCALPATELSRWRRLMRSSLLRLCTPESGD